MGMIRMLDADAADDVSLDQSSPPMNPAARREMNRRIGSMEQRGRLGIKLPGGAELVTRPLT